MGGAATLAASSLQPNAQSATSGQGENTAHFASRSSVNLPRIPGRSPKFKQNAGGKLRQPICGEAIHSGVSAGFIRLCARKPCFLRMQEKDEEKRLETIGGSCSCG